MINFELDQASRRNETSIQYHVPIAVSSYPPHNMLDMTEILITHFVENDFRVTVFTNDDESDFLLEISFAHVDPPR